MTESDEVIAILKAAFEHPYHKDGTHAIQMASQGMPEWVFDRDGIVHVRLYRTAHGLPNAPLVDGGRFDIWCDEITKNTVTHVILGGFEVIEFLVGKIPELAIRLARNGRQAAF